MHESAPQTAARLRRFLNERWPASSFSVRTTPAADLRVEWAAGPTLEQVARDTRGFARVVDGERQEPTLWLSRRGGASLVWPGAELLLLTRRS